MSIIFVICNSFAHSNFIIFVIRDTCQRRLGMVNILQLYHFEPQQQGGNFQKGRGLMSSIVNKKNLDRSSIFLIHYIFNGLTFLWEGSSELINILQWYLKFMFQIQQSSNYTNWIEKFEFASFSPFFWLNIFIQCHITL